MRHQLGGEQLLAGPRGRRLCWSAVRNAAIAFPGWRRRWQWEPAGAPTELASELSAAIAATDLDTLAASDEPALLGLLAESVDAARYWQEPDEVDQALALAEVAETLRPVAAALVAAPGAAWWSSPLALEHQHYVEWLAPRGAPPTLSGAADELATWHASSVEEDRRARSRPDDPAAPFSGWWWSTPRPSRLPTTTRGLSSIGAVGLALVEDRIGASEARCWPLVAPRAPRVHELSGPDDWVELVARYPLEVSRSRRHDWFKVTGRTGDWLIPDWEAAAADLDAVHLSVAGYLATAGRALSVGGAASMVAGWDPDATCWLTDVLHAGAPPTRWRCSRDAPTHCQRVPET